jgi:hypothetical protein
MAAVQQKPDELQYFYAPRPTCVSRLTGTSLLEQKITRGAEAKGDRHSLAVADVI